MSALPAIAAARPASLDAVDRAIVLETQAGLPLTPCPRAPKATSRLLIQLSA